MLVVLLALTSSPHHRHDTSAESLSCLQLIQNSAATSQPSLSIHFQIVLIRKASVQVVPHVLLCVPDVVCEPTR